MPPLLIQLALVAVFPLFGGHTLFKDGRSNYSIVVARDASTSERTAAAELSDCLFQMSGARLPVVEEGSGKGPAIHVGYTARTAAVSGQAKPEENDESFTYRSAGRDLLIWGGAGRGTMYGVFSFLEKELGVRWYAPGFTRIPQRGAWSFRKLRGSGKPALLHRQTNYYAVEKDPVWNAHNLLNSLWSPVSNEYGGISSYWGAHTMGRFVPENEFFDSHPEYFSMIDGKRVRGAQRCLSNPDVLKICTERLIQTIGEHPDSWVYSLSQNDNRRPCTCDRCRELEDRYGGHSGILLWFVNQVADEVKKVYPDKFVGTFAYQYTRKAPRDIVPQDNVVIRLCDIECCFAHPLSECPNDRPFLEDFAQWGKICKHIFIWDYIVNYSQYLAPFPNFGVLASNIRTFRDHHAIGVFEEAQYQSPAAEFAELRAWVTAKLLWDPEQDTDALVRDFIAGYYGAPAPYIQEYFDKTQALVKDDTHFRIYFRHDDPLYTDRYITEATALLEKARAAAQSEREVDEVDKVRMQILYLKILRDRETSLSDGSYAEFLRIARKTGTRISERFTLEQFLEKNFPERTQ